MPKPLHSPIPSKAVRRRCSWYRRWDGDHFTDHFGTGGIAEGDGYFHPLQGIGGAIAQGAHQFAIGFAHFAHFNDIATGKTIGLDRKGAGL